MTTPENFAQAMDLLIRGIAPSVPEATRQDIARRFGEDLHAAIGEEAALAWDRLIYGNSFELNGKRVDPRGVLLLTGNDGEPAGWKVLRIEEPDRSSWPDVAELLFKPAGRVFISSSRPAMRYIMDLLRPRPTPSN